MEEISIGTLRRDEPRSIIVFHAGALGDLVNTLPALAGLRARFAGARICAVGNRDWLGLFAAAGVVDEAVSLERPGMHRLFGDGPLPAEVGSWLAEFDLAVAWMRSPTLLGHLAGLGVRTAALAGPFPPPAGSGHASDYLAGPVRELGVGRISAHPRLDLPADALSHGPRFAGIVVHPGSGSRRKNWPAEKFAAAARTIMGRTGLSAAALEGPADEGPAGELAGMLSGIKIFSGLNPLELAGLLSGAALVVANDSGVAHLAGALGARVAAVYGPTDAAVWGVRQERAANIVSPAACAPCSREAMERCAARECLDRISAETVAGAAVRLLSAH